ncbi:MAG: hypothetical protein KC656_08100, partial [Myxococcales bacterium]|nr:hypothetical protein [Myxococcales bacterium]
MLSMLALLAPGHAQETLSCTGLDADICNNLNAMVPQLNDFKDPGGPNFIDETATKARRPSRLYAQMVQMMDLAQTSGCTIDGWTGAVYDRTGFDWITDGGSGVEKSPDDGDRGTLDRGAHQFSAITGSKP